jgi:hypothetical protein
MSRQEHPVEPGLRESAKEPASSGNALKASRPIWGSRPALAPVFGCRISREEWLSDKISNIYGGLIAFWLLLQPLDKQHDPVRVRFRQFTYTDIEFP